MQFFGTSDWTIARLVRIGIVLVGCSALLAMAVLAMEVRDAPDDRGAVFTLYGLCATAVLGASLLLARWIAHTISMPIAELTEAVWSMSNGETPAPPRAAMPLELKVLSSALFVAFEERRAALHKVQCLAHYDGVTGALSRAYFEHRTRNLMQIMMRARESATLLYIDLDRFKEINDDYGHDAGDVLLRAVVTRARARLRSADLIGRRGGDEFVLFLPNLANPADIAALGEDLAALITASVDLARDTLGQVGASMGAAVFPDDADTFDALVTCADKAMYEAKRAGGGRLRFASGAMVEFRPAARVSP